MQLCQQAGELEQYLVTMDTVVDFIYQAELVDVQVQHSVLAVSLLSVAQRPLHLVHESVAIDQPGQGVVVAGKAQGFLHVLERFVQTPVHH